MPESLLKLHSLLFAEKPVRTGCEGNKITVNFSSLLNSFVRVGFKSQKLLPLNCEMHILGDLKASNNQV